MIASILSPEQRLVALALYADRHTRRVHPDGRFDDAGRWDPSETERQPCCDFVRGPSRQWPYSLMVHCRTRRHCVALVASGWRPPAPSPIRTATPRHIGRALDSGAFPRPPDTPLEEFLAGVETLLAEVAAASAAVGLEIEA